MSNPVLDEIPDACLSDEMREQLMKEMKEENSNRIQELEILRKHIVRDYDKLLDDSKESQKLCHESYLALSSTDILKKFLGSHFVAYADCMQKAYEIFSTES